METRNVLRTPAAVLGIVLGRVLAAPGQAEDYYVDPEDGADINSGTSAADAWETITKAVGTVSSGDLINLMAGTHIGSITGPDSTRWYGNAAAPTAAKVSIALTAAHSS